MTDLFKDAVQAGTLDAGEVGPPPYRLPSLAEALATEPNGLKAVSTFSGAGGSSLGLRRAGWDVPYAVEFIEAAADTYAANFPGSFIFRDDIRTLPVSLILNMLDLDPGELDLLEGSPPCASFTPGGMRERGWGEVKTYSDTEQRTDDLFDEFARLLEGLQPRAFIAENVPGMLMGPALDEYARYATAMLGKAGYVVSAMVLNAANFGAPQHRRRLIFVGFREGEDWGGWWWPAPTTPEPHTLRQALELVTDDDPEDVAAGSMVGFAVGRTWEWKRGLREKDACARCGELLQDHEKTYRERGAVKKGAGAGGETYQQAVYFCEDGEQAVEVKDYSRLYVPELDEPCPTLTATGAEPGAAAVVHPTECRKLTPREMLAICGFPLDFTLTGTRQQRCERMGRAVPPPLYSVLGSALARALSDPDD